MSSINLSKQTVNLSKKQVINLSKASEGLKGVMVGLGWDEAEAGYREVTEIVNPGFLGKLFGAQPKEVTKRIYKSKEYDYDLDAWIAFMQDGKIVNAGTDVLYFGNKDIYRNGVNLAHHHGDNLTGAGDGDDEQIDINLDKLPEEYNGVVIGVTIYSARERHQEFGDIKNFFVRVVDTKDNFEICRYSDSVAHEYKDCYTFIVGKIYKDKGEWQFKSEGYGTRDENIMSAVRNYKG